MSFLCFSHSSVVHLLVHSPNTMDAIPTHCLITKEDLILGLDKETQNTKILPFCLLNDI